MESNEFFGLNLMSSPLEKDLQGLTLERKDWLVMAPTELST